MTYTTDILLGRITKTNGFEGAVTVKLEKVFIENIPQMESVFLEVEGRLVPFFIALSEYSGAGTIKLKFEGYDSIEKINEFTGSRVFLTTIIFQINQDNTQDLNGYDVFVDGDKLIGTIIEVISNPGQLLLSILSINNRNILIPFHKHFIVSIDKPGRIIVMDIPDGLLEIND